MTMKRGLIFPRSGMGNVYYSQGLPRIYGQLAPNLVGLYDFSERTGGTVYNLAQNAYHGTLTYGATGNTTAQQMWDNGKPGGLDFDGVSDYCDFGDLLLTYCDYNKPFSIELWMAINTVTTVNYALCSQYDRNVINNYYGVRISHENFSPYRIEFDLWQNGDAYATGRIAIRTSNAPSFTNGKYFHLVCTYDGTSNRPSGMKIYINGADQSSTTYQSTAALDGTIWTYNTCNTRIGNTSHTYGSTNYWGDETAAKFALYTKELTSTEILTLYNYEKQFVR